VLQAVIFDLDGLLADTEPIHYESWRHVLEGTGQTLGWKEYGDHWIRAGQSIEDYLVRHEIVGDPAVLRQRKSQHYLDLVEKELRPMPGAIDLLNCLRSRVLLALATSSWQDHAQAALRKLNVTDFFDVVAVGESVARLKPYPDIFLYVAEQLSVVPSGCVVLEDAEKGVRAARAAGMAVVAVPSVHTRSNDFSAASLVVESLHEITLQKLERLVPEPGVSYRSP
jgi:HAD superfamily hydrolase (TIGR01509 family)